jgi:hypothetical protein
VKGLGLKPEGLVQPWAVVAKLMRAVSNEARELLLVYPCSTLLFVFDKPDE